MGAEGSSRIPDRALPQHQPVSFLIYEEYQDHVVVKALTNQLRDLPDHCIQVQRGSDISTEVANIFDERMMLLF